MDDSRFGVFIQDNNNNGPLWRGFFADIDEAKRKAKELATAEGFEFFVYSLENCSEIARFFPARHKPCAPQAQSGIDLNSRESTGNPGHRPAKEHSGSSV